MLRGAGAATRSSAHAPAPFDGYYGANLSACGGAAWGGVTGARICGGARVERRGDAGVHLQLHLLLE